MTTTPAAKEETPEQIAEWIAWTYAPSHAARAHLRQAMLCVMNERERRESSKSTAKAMFAKRTVGPR